MPKVAPGPQTTGVADKALSGAQSTYEQNKRLIYMIILGLHQIGPDGVLRELFPPERGYLCLLLL